MTLFNNSIKKSGLAFNGGAVLRASGTKRGMNLLYGSKFKNNNYLTGLNLDINRIQIYSVGQKNVLSVYKTGSLNQKSGRYTSSWRASGFNIEERGTGGSKRNLSGQQFPKW